MATTTIRISARSREILTELAQSSKMSMREIADKAVEAYRRQRFWEEVNAAYAALQTDPEGWQEVERERQAWDATLGDGLE